MDDGPVRWYWIFVFAFLILGGVYFAGAEISLASVNRVHMLSGASKGDKRAKRVLYILDNFEEALSVLLIGNNVMHISCATVATVLASEIWGSKAVALSTVITTVVLFLFAEMIPKCFAKSCNESFAMAISKSLIVLMIVLKPLSKLFALFSASVTKHLNTAEETPTMTEDELHDIVENISDETNFDVDTGKLVKSALDFTDATVNEILTPWNEVQKISSSMKNHEILEIVKTTTHSRLPVVDRQGKVKGVIQIRNFLKSYLKNKNFILASVLDYPYYSKDDIPLNDLLNQMSNHRRNMAIIKDKNGEISGVVTVEDIMEELVGEIYDEEDIGGDASDE